MKKSKKICYSNREMLSKMDCRLDLLIRSVFLLATLKVCSSCFSNNTFNTVSVETGSSFYQECFCEEAGFSVGDLKWLGPGNEEIQLLGSGTISDVFIERKSQSVSLHIPHASKSNSGAYRCVSLRGGHQFVKAYAIQAYDKLYFVNTDKKQFITKGTNSLIKCKARGETDPLITWYRGEDLPIQLTDDAKYMILPNGLQINDVQHEDNGTYICSASVLETGEEVEKVIHVEVIAIPAIEDLRATPISTVIVGDPITIECLATGKPLPKVSWIKITKDYKKGRTKSVPYAKDTNKLVFPHAVSSDHAAYTCVASNQAGNVSRTIDIQVLIPAQIYELKNVTTSEGSHAQIICKAAGRPAPKLSMTFFGELGNDNSIVYEEIRSATNDSESMFVLTFLNITRSHAGQYACNASNEVGSVNVSTEMTVLHKPYFKKPIETVWGWNGISVNLSCFYESSPPGKLKWRYLENREKSYDLEYENETEIELSFETDPKYGVYQCVVNNDIGEATKEVIVKQAHPPPPVQNITIFEVTATSVTLDIQAPGTVEGPSLIGYTAEYDAEDNYKHTSIHYNRTWSVDRPFRIEGLKPGTKYLIKIAAINDVGTGAWSQVMMVNTPNKSVPNPPTWSNDTVLENTFLNDTNFFIEWSAPENNGDPIDYYILRSCPITEGDIVWDKCEDLVLSPETTQLYTSDYLEYNTSYHLLLMAHNAEGNSSAAELYITTPSISHPLEPQELTLSAEVIIGLTITIVILSIIALDVLLFFFLHKGMIANIYYRKSKKIRRGNTFSRDKKGLLRDNVDSMTKGEKQANRSTGVITGKHSAV